MSEDDKSVAERREGSSPSRPIGRQVFPDREVHYDASALVSPVLRPKTNWLQSLTYCAGLADPFGVGIAFALNWHESETRKAHEDCARQSKLGTSDEQDTERK
jgi:hypothetical protein